MKMNKQLGTALAAFALFGLLAVGLARLIPMVAGHQPSAITLSDRAAGALSEVQVKNSSGSYTILREGGKLICPQLEMLPVSYDALDAFAQGCTSIEAVSGIKLPEAAELGFDRPRATVGITFLDASTLTLTIGAQTQEKDGYYARLAPDGPVYLLAEDEAAPFFAPASSYLDLSLANNPAGSTGLPDSITLREGESVLTVSAVAGPDGSPLHTVSDGTLTLVADEESLLSFFGQLGSLSAGSVVQLFLSDAELQSYGILDAAGLPVRQLSFSMGGAVTTLSIGNRSGEDYYVRREGTDAVFTLPLSRATWDGASLFLLMRAKPMQPAAAGIEKITVDTVHGSYEILPDGSGLVGTVNGAPLSDRTFGQLYALLFSFEAQYPLEGAPEAILPELVLTIHSRASDPAMPAPVHTVRFIPYGLRRHAIEIDGTPLWAVRSGYVQQLTDVLLNLEDGMTISQSW